KMTRRHPHVFGEATAGTAQEVLRQWEEIKRAEKGDAAPGSSALDGIPRSLPALARAERLGEKAARLGFDWTRPEEVLDKVGEEVAEVGRARAREGPEGVAEEFGDVLFALANLARHLGVHAETALRGANDRFTARFKKIEGDLRTPKDPAELERLW